MIEKEAIELLKTLKENEVRESELKEEQKIFKATNKKIEDDLIKFFKEQLKEDEKYKLNSDYGNITKKNLKKWVYSNEEELKVFLAENMPELLRVKETIDIDKDSFKKMVEVAEGGEILLDDEIIDYVRVEDTQSISIKIK